MAERLVRKPENEERLDDYLMYLRHLAAYQFALSNFNGARIIDLGCGTGYGTELMAEKGRFVVGVDLADYALPNFTKKKNLSFSVGSVCHLPFRNFSFELAISFQVIEHIKDIHFFLTETHRILSQKGVLILSTPNRNLRLLPLEPPWNEYHIKEYSPTQLKLLLKKHFATVNVFGLQATPEIESMERKRIREAKQWYYKQLVLDGILNLPLGKQGLEVARKLKQKLLMPKPINTSVKRISASHSSFHKTFSIENFWVSDEYVNQRMDLLAICQK